jgi:putative transposase
MANTFTQIIIHFVFVVKGRSNLIDDNIKDTIEKYMCGIIKENKSKPLSIYCNPDHVHILIGLHPEISVSKMAGLVKGNASKFIHEQKMIKGKFEWQSGYGAFSASRSAVPVISKYILNQKEHHSKSSFKKEYVTVLKENEIEFTEKYLPEFYDADLDLGV